MSVDILSIGREMNTKTTYDIILKQELREMLMIFQLYKGDCYVWENYKSGNIINIISIKQLF